MSDAKTPTLLTYNYSIMIYDAMNNLAKEEPAIDLKPFGYPAQIDEKVSVFRGTGQKIADDLGFRASTGQRCMSLLASMRCITLLKSGGNKHPSIYLLHYRPTEAQYDQFRNHVASQDAKINPSRYQILLDDLTKLRESLNQSNRRIADLETRVSTLESIIAIGGRSG